MISPAEQIKERLSIEEVVSSYLKLEKAGKNLKARCPFHSEKTPSFFVSPDRGSYYCFGCGAKGDIFSFVEEFEGLDFRGALKVLADRAGISLREWNQEKEGEKDRLYRAVLESAGFFEKNLWQNEEALKYLRDRGLKDSTIKEFKLGWAQEEWRALFSHLKTLGFSEKEMEQAGLIKKADNGSGFYDRFRGRIVFPISDSSGRVIAFSGRIFKDDLPALSTGQAGGRQVISQAKYLNSPETPIFNKSSVLYGLDKAKDSIRRNNFSIMVEGQMDLLLSHQAGFRNTVATSGTALSESTISKISSEEERSREKSVSGLGLLGRLSQNIILSFDADKAGFGAAMRAGRIALSLGMDVKIASIPEGMDPADVISKLGPDAWKKAVRDSCHIIEFVLRAVLKESGKDARKAGRGIREKVLPYVLELPSRIERDVFIKKIADLSGISESALREDLAGLEKEKGSSAETGGRSGTGETKNFPSRKDYIKQRILGIILWQKKLPEPAINVEEVLDKISDMLGCKAEEIFSGTQENEGDLIFEAEVFYGGDVDIRKDFDELARNFVLEHLRETLASKMNALHGMESRAEKEGAEKILREINEINKKIQELKTVV